MLRLIRATGLIALLATAACGGAQGQANPAPDDGQLVPLGYGRLNQDDLSIRLTAGDLEVRFVPMEESLLRLLSPDAYRALHDLRESRRGAIDSLARRHGTGTPGVALVTFFAARAGQQYQPQELALSVQNQQFRPLAIIPVSTNFTSQQLENRGQASALYLFESPIPVLQEFVLSYQDAMTDAWKTRVSTINREHDRIMLRVRAARTDSTHTP